MDGIIQTDGEQRLYRPTPRVLCEVPLGTSFRIGEPLPVRARDDLDPCSPPLEYADGRVSWDGYPTREARDEARIIRDQREEAERAGGLQQAERRRQEELRVKQQSLHRRVQACQGHVVVATGPAYGFTGPVAVEPYTEEEPRAHGNITRQERCRCGAVRDTNVNQGWVEYGPWSTPTLDAGE